MVCPFNFDCIPFLQPRRSTRWLKTMANGGAEAAGNRALPLAVAITVGAPRASASRGNLFFRASAKRVLSEVVRLYKNTRYPNLAEKKGGLKVVSE